MSADNPLIHIDRMALEGDGVGRIQSGGSAGKVGFVPYSLPGEDIAGIKIFEKKNHSRWLPGSVRHASKSRVSPPCPYHFTPEKKVPSCGGCNWQHINESYQSRLKRDLLIETLDRMGGVKLSTIPPTVPSPHMWRYRNKVQVPFQRQKGKTVAGFYAPGSHQIVEFEDCLVQPALSVEIVGVIKKMVQQLKLRPYDEDRHTGWLRHVLVRTNEKNEALVSFISKDDSFPQRHLIIETLRERFPSIVGIHQNIQPAKSHVILGRRWISLWGNRYLQETINGLNFNFSAGSFFQVNTKAAELLFKEAMNQLGSERWPFVLDLFCGVGTLTLMAARQANQAVGIEVVPSAVQDARHNAKLNGLQHVEFLESDVETYFKRHHEAFQKYVRGKKWAVLLDPPRSGCDEKSLRVLLSAKPDRIVYVSCNPSTLARDIKILSSRYTLKTVVPFDLFPQTSHIESVSCLVKK